MSFRQESATCRDPACDKTMGQLLCSLLAALILIPVEGEIDGTLALTQLAELVGVEMRAQ
jgi:hypothetical protein